MERLKGQFGWSIVCDGVRVWGNRTQIKHGLLVSVLSEDEQEAINVSGRKMM